MPDRTIRIDLLAVDEASPALARLSAELRTIQAEQTRLSQTTFNAFSRNQIAPQIAALEQHASAVRKSIAEVLVLQQTLGGSVDISKLINSVTGLNREIKEASTSGNVLKRSIGALAQEDSAVRDAALAATAARAAVSRTRANAENAAEAAVFQRSVEAAQRAESFPGYGRTPSAGRLAAEARAKEPETTDVDKLAERLLQQKAIAETIRINPTMAALAIAEVERLSAKISALVATGAQGESLALGSVLRAQADAERLLINEKLFQEAGKEYTVRKAIAATIRESNENEARRIQTARQLQSHLVPQSQESTADIIRRTTGAGQGAQFTAYEIANWGKSYESATRSAKGLKEATDGATESHFQLGRSLQHITGIGDSLVRGQRGQAISSFSALIRDTGL